MSKSWLGRNIPDIIKSFDTVFKKRNSRKRFTLNGIADANVCYSFDTFHPLTASRVNFRSAFGGMEKVSLSQTSRPPVD